MKKYYCTINNQKIKCTKNTKCTHDICPIHKENRCCANCKDIGTCNFCKFLEQIK